MKEVVLVDRSALELGTPENPISARIELSAGAAAVLAAISGAPDSIQATSAATADATERLAGVLERAVDLGEQQPIYTREIPRPGVVDADGRPILSDCIGPFVGYGRATGDYILWVDTKGYSSVVLQISGTWAGSIAFYGVPERTTPIAGISPENPGRIAAAGYSVGSASSASVTTTGNGAWVFPATFRYLAVVFNARTSGTPIATAWCRTSPFTPAQISTPSVNLQQVGAVNLPAIGTTITTHSALAVAAVDLATNTNRRLNLVRGNYVNWPDSHALAVKNVTPDEDAGESTPQLLRQVLNELRIMNYYLYELPRLIASGQQNYDEPQAFRNDPSFLKN